MGFERFAESLDADEPLGKTYTFRISVAPGDSLTSATLLEVESTSTTAPLVSLVTISQQSTGMISPGLYGVTFRAQGKGVPGFTFVRCRYSTARGSGDDETYQIKIEQR